MPTNDKLYIYVELFAYWRIEDPLQYFLRLRDEHSAQSRLDDYNESSQAMEFYEFTRMMHAYRSIVSADSTIKLSTESDIFKYFKGMYPDPNRQYKDFPSNHLYGQSEENNRALECIPGLP